MVELKEVEMSAFQAALDFHNSGQLGPDAIPADDQYEHPLLQLADRYNLHELKQDYLDIALKKFPPTATHAAWHLSLWMTVNDTEKKAKCIHLIASGMMSGSRSKAVPDSAILDQFLGLSLDSVC